MPARQRAAIGLGGNLGDVPATLRSALRSLSALEGSRVAAVSRFYRTPPWGLTAQPVFVNAAVVLDTTLSPARLMSELLAIEAAHGRVRAADGADRWGPRTLDLDLLLCGETVLDVPGLRLPHPQLHVRAFVLVPLAEIAAAWVIPGHGTVADCCAALASEGIEALP
jgi:2-amino-4-hydroxy-6-hydroxymethyldihydropteridine diphosphokinase